jgi:hypothetical protein
LVPQSADQCDRGRRVSGVVLCGRDLERAIHLLRNALHGCRRLRQLRGALDGTVNLFVFLDAHRPWRKVKVTDSRTARNIRQSPDRHHANRLPIPADQEQSIKTLKNNKKIEKQIKF